MRSYMKIIVSVLIILNLFSISITASELNGVNGGITLEEKFNQLIPELLEKYKVPGISVGLIKNGELEAILNYGVQDKEENKLISNNTDFQVASLSKSLTAWGVMKLVDEGKIDIDAPAEKYLKRWHIPDSEFDENEVTIRRLLSHTAGLSVGGYSGANPNDSRISIEESLSTVDGGVKLKSEPGSEFSYSGGGYTVLQLIIEEVTNMSFHEYMESEILKPLGMENSWFNNNYVSENMSMAYGDFNNKITSYNFTEEAAAGLRTNVSDFSKFIIANMDNEEGVKGKGVLKSESVDLIQTPIQKNYGLGIISEKLSDDNTLLLHSGSNIGWCSYYLMIPEKKDGIIIFTNGSSGNDLLNDISGLWLEEETGSLPESYHYVNRMRQTVLIVSIVILALIVLYLSNFIMKIRRGKRVFISKLNKINYWKISIRSIVCISLSYVWYLYFYNNGMASGITFRFKNIAIEILLFIIIILITMLFPKVNNKISD